MDGESDDEAECNFLPDAKNCGARNCGVAAYTNRC